MKIIQIKKTIIFIVLLAAGILAGYCALWTIRVRIMLAVWLLWPPSSFGGVLLVLYGAIVAFLAGAGAFFLLKRAFADYWVFTKTETKNSTSKEKS